VVENRTKTLGFDVYHANAALLAGGNARSATDTEPPVDDVPESFQPGHRSSSNATRLGSREEIAD
jgi:hypothetical protein